MEVGLAVIAITTAAKDIVEVGQKIYESFAKVPNNFRNAQRTLEDVKEMVEAIETFCEVHQDALDGMKDFHDALLGLLGKFRSFEASVLPLLPQPSGSMRDRISRGLDAWRNNNRIERSVADLQSDVIKVMQRYMLKSAMRTEFKLETIHEETSKVLTGISQRLEALADRRAGVYALRIPAAAATTRDPFEPSGATGNEVNRNIILFAQSTPSSSVPMLRTPDVITEELMTTAYIKFQINAIAKTIAGMSVPHVFTPNAASDTAASNIIDPYSVGDFKSSPQLEEKSMTLTHLRHHIVRKVTELRDLLEDKQSPTICAIEATVALNELATGLEVLDMSQDSLQVGKWAISLSRMLVDASGGRRLDFDAILAHLLLNQSCRYDNSGDNAQGLKSIMAAYTISQKLRNQFSSEVEFHLLHAKILFQHVVFLTDGERSTRMRIEGIRVLESILGVQAFTHLEIDADVSLVVRPNSAFFDHLFSLTPPISAIINYAYALEGLGSQLLVDGHTECGLDLVLLAIAIHRKLISVHGPEHGVGLAMCLSSVIQGKAAGHIPAEMRVDMADECIQLLQELVEKNPLRYAQTLVGVLSKKSIALENLDQDSEAITAWEEAAGIAEQIVQDSTMYANALGSLSDIFRRLGRYDDAVRTGKLAVTTHYDRDEIQAPRYLNLSEDLRRLHRYKEAAEAARKAVVLYQQLTMRNPRQWMADLAEGLSELALSLATLGCHPVALNSWRESVGILDNCLGANSDASPAFIAAYCAALRKYISISYVLENEEDYLQVSSMACQYFQRLSEIYPENTDIIQDWWYAEFCYAYNMLRVGRLQDIEQYIDRCVDIWSRKSTVVPESDWLESHATMILLKSYAFHMQGHTEEALSTIRKACSVAGQSVRAPLSSSSVMIDSMIIEAHMQLDIGNSKEALQIAEGALQLSRSHKQDLNVNSFVGSLLAVSFIALSRQNYTRTIQIAQEGCDICATPSWQTDEQEYNSSLRPSLLATLSFAEANLGRCDAAMEYACRAVDASLDIGDKKWAASPTTAEGSYMLTRGNLAEIQIATGEFYQAREICEERRVYFSKRVETRMGEYRNLAPILRMLGVLCCSEGRHEEGEAYAQELSCIMKRLGCASPSLQEQVKKCLRRQAEVPILGVLNDMTQKLDCRHQVEVSSLYEIRNAS